MKSHILGLPRIGPQRELKFALEHFWKSSQDDAEHRQLQQVGAELRRQNWRRQVDAGLDFLTVGDFAWYDHVLQNLSWVGGLPTRFTREVSREVSCEESALQKLFTCARGNTQHFAMEMTKWFDTNYHYLVPEYTPDLRFTDCADELIAEVRLAQTLYPNYQHAIKPVLVGPLSLLYLGKEKQGLSDRLTLLPVLLETYRKILQRLSAEGVRWVQIDEPILALELPDAWRNAFAHAYQELSVGAKLGNTSPQLPQLLIATYFDAIDDVATLATLPVAGWHIDLTSSAGTNEITPAEYLAQWLAALSPNQILSCGVVSGRNIWRSNLDAVLSLLAPAKSQLAERLWVASSCSLLHVPVDLANEHAEQFDPRSIQHEVFEWLAFGQQKIEEVALLKQALHDVASCALSLQQARAIQQQRQTSTLRSNAFVQKRIAETNAAHANRAAPYPARIAAQRQRFQLPLFPTTTIGSFPQTRLIRTARAAFKRGELPHLDYLEAMRLEIRQAIEKQEAYGLDVLVHGEAERNDMVEYFGEQLNGYTFTQLGWVQSYGSRCVKPPIIYGDVQRVEAMTVEWAKYAQSLTQKPVKGMLTGPVTMLQWAFVRDDQPRATTALQIALAIRDEVCDLEKAGIGIIQIDEPAFREGLPLKQRHWPAYLAWAVQAFRISAAGVRNETQIHTHMCYSEFNDILDSIAALDADVITIETSRSDMELLRGFQQFSYPNDIGPGVYDIHSPRIPQVNEMARLLEKAAQVIPAERLWVNPDCGLKTRGWPEVDAALLNMVRAARELRLKYQQ